MIGWDSDNPYRFDKGRMEFPPGEIEGEFWFEDLTLPVIFTMNAPTDDELHENNPGQWMVPADRKSIMIWVHESVPSSIMEVIALHELVEYRLYNEYHVPLDFAHRVALVFEEAYSRVYLSPEELQVWIEYRDKVGRFDHSAQLNELIK